MLNEWCVYDDVTALACLMQHTPRLENLILQLEFEVILGSFFLTDYFTVTALATFLGYIPPPVQNT
jgi:hypothetical protein